MVYSEDWGEVELKGARLSIEKLYKNEDDEIPIIVVKELIIPQTNGVEIQINLQGLLDQDPDEVTGDTTNLERLEKLFI